VKLLLDENLSDRIIAQILDLYPDSAHIKSHGLTRASDTDIWSFAKRHGYIIVSKDADFHHRSLLLGHPPKLVFLRIGNCPTSRVVQLLRTNYVKVTAFDADPQSSILIIS
jgi:predicted nuclease of predicted toxin-antitoxin system